jgi:hypothetical protein
VVRRVIHEYKNNTHVRDILAAALAVVITPSLMAAAAARNVVCMKEWKYHKQAKRRRYTYRTS